MGGFKHIEPKEDTAEWQRRTIEWEFGVQSP